MLILLLSVSYFFYLILEQPYRYHQNYKGLGEIGSTKEYPHTPENVHLSEWYKSIASHHVLQKSDGLNVMSLNIVNSEQPFINTKAPENVDSLARKVELLIMEPIPIELVNPELITYDPTIALALLSYMYVSKVFIYYYFIGS
jgi:hypothetical protein